MFVELCQNDVERNLIVSQMQFQGVDNTAFDLLHLFHDQLVVNRHLYLWQFFNDRCHVLHASGNSTVLLGHTVAHGNPFASQVGLGKFGLILCCGAC